MEDKKYTTVSLPLPLAKSIEKRIEGTGFNSVSSYIIYVLRQIISESSQEEKKEAFSKDDEDKVKARLKGLGYLD